MFEEVDANRALIYLNGLLTKHGYPSLDATQTVIVRETLVGATYAQIQAKSNYSLVYLRARGSKLFENVSACWGLAEKINKKKFCVVLARKMQEECPEEVQHPAIASSLWLDYFLQDLLRSAHLHDWLVVSPYRLGHCRAHFETLFETLRQEQRYEQAHHEWMQVRGIAHVYDWSELAEQTLLWLRSQADRHVARSSQQASWLYRCDLSWLRSLRGRPGEQRRSYGQLEALWNDRIRHGISPLMQFQVVLYLVATALALREHADAERWLAEARRLSRSSPNAQQTDMRWERCRLDELHYRAEWCFETRRWSRSAELYRQAIREAQDLACGRAIARNRLGLARVWQAQARVEDAEFELSEGFAMASAHHDRRGAGFFARERAFLRRKRGDRQAARRWSQVATQNFEVLDMTVQLQKLHDFQQNL